MRIRNTEVAGWAGRSSARTRCWAKPGLKQREQGEEGEGRYLDSGGVSENDGR
jgi:hypothetical protein